MKPTSQLFSSLLAIVFCLSWQESQGQVSQPAMTGLKSLWAFGNEKGSAEQSRVVGMVGFFGQEQPSQWMILVSDARNPGHYREYISRQGRTVNMRNFQGQPGQDIPSIPLPLAQMKVDSDQAFRICNLTAGKAGVGFDSLHYQLRCRDLRNEPVWVVNLLDRHRTNVGVIYLSAVDGSILRTVWNKPSSAEQFTQVPRTGPGPQAQYTRKRGLLDRLFNRDRQEAPAISGPPPQRQQQPAATYQQPQGNSNVPAPPQFLNGR